VLANAKSTQKMSGSVEKAAERARYIEFTRQGPTRRELPTARDPEEEDRAITAVGAWIEAVYNRKRLTARLATRARSSTKAGSGPPLRRQTPRATVHDLRQPHFWPGVS
jgi:hypothetical protein